MNTCPYAVGTEIEYSGYKGTVTRICDWSDSMIEIRVPGGIACVDYHEVTRPLTAREAKVWKRIMRDRDDRIALASRRIKANRA